MTLVDASPGRPLDLAGSAYERGWQQAALCPDMVDHVRHAIDHRLTETASAIALPGVRDWIDGQRRYTSAHYPDILEEIRGIAAGFGVTADAIFIYLHCSIAAELAGMAERAAEGCTSFAVTAGSSSIVAKNRDYRPEHIPIQRVFRHVDPAWTGRRILCVGSLGSPGNFSSGMNSDGFAVTDTNSRTTDHGVGMHRYFLLTWLLVNCRTVDDALAAIRGMMHTGGGLLLMGDAVGAVAAVELGHRSVGIERRAAGRVSRTNHFVTPAMAGANLVDQGYVASHANSEARLPAVAALVRRADPEFGADQAAAILAHHRDGKGEALCRHGGADPGHTISASVYETGRRRLYFAAGNPCAGAWQSFDFATN